MSLLAEIAVYLACAVVAVPLFKRLGLGSVLGYLAAGIVIGPSGLGLFSDVDNILHFAEFGVVLLLFVIGLELQPKRLWVFRKAIMGLGSSQVLLSAVVIGAMGYMLGLTLSQAVVVGFGLSLSSTAFALQTLAEKNQLAAKHGRAAFAVLLMQDLAVIPLLAVIPYLGPDAVNTSALHPAVAVLKPLLVLLAVVVVGHFLLRPVLRIVAASKTPEIFTAMTLLTVIGTALLMEQIGLSMALGAFLAGVLLADSEYRHELEADIEPFKGLLLGLFFIAVGMSVNMGILVSHPFSVLGLVGALVLAKMLVLFVLGMAQGLGRDGAIRLSISISQGGEFAFVIFGVAVTAGVMSREVAEFLVLAVTLSMVTTPLLFALFEVLQRRSRPAVSEAFEQPLSQEQHVIIAGFGRFGQVVARVLRAKRVPFTALDVDPEQVALVKRFGNKAYYGDASRLEVLRAAKVGDAAAMVLAIDDVETSVRAAQTVRRHFPGLKLFARARNRQHAYRLMDLDIQVVWRETLFSSLDMTRAVLRGIGFPGDESDRAVERFRLHDQHLLYAHHHVHGDPEKLVDLSKQAAKELEELLEEDERESIRP